MILSKPDAEIVTGTEDLLSHLEWCARIAYKSHPKHDDQVHQLVKEEGLSLPDAHAKATDEFLGRILNQTPPHESVIEHGAITAWARVDRGVTHEWVRHRLASITQESTRYVDYGGECEFIIPPHLNLQPGKYHKSFGEIYCNGEIIQIEDDATLLWVEGRLYNECEYKALRNAGWAPQDARGALPNATKSEIVFTANPREWRHVLRLRGSKRAHPQMQEVMKILAPEFALRWPLLFAEFAEVASV
jgi:thymidylate synthase (FAD)